MAQRKLSKDIANVCSVRPNQNVLTPTNKKTSKSPISHSKCSHQTTVKQNVSYGQLQIVLQNIQTIKQKASSQVKQLNEENTLLKEEITQMESCIEKLTQKIKENDDAIHKVEQNWKEKLLELEQDKRDLTRRIQDKDKANDLLNVKINELQKSLSKERESLALTSRELDELKKKWNWAFSILAGDSSRAEEIVWRIKQKQVDLWGLFDQLDDLQAADELKDHKLDTLSQQYAHLKDEHRSTREMLDKSLNQLKVANEKLGNSQKQVREYYASIIRYKDEKINLQGHLQALARENSNLKAIISQLEHQNRGMLQELRRKEAEGGAKDRRIEFTSIVNQVCDESEDYGKVLDRIHYLQRFRKQHYFDVQKIQYLCKLLDN